MVFSASATSLTQTYKISNSFQLIGLEAKPRSHFKPGTPIDIKKRVMANIEQTKIEGKAMTAKDGLTIVTDESFGKEVLEDRGPVLVEFGAEWCAPCRVVAPILKELASEFKGNIKICQIDIDGNKQIANQHGIQSIPTFLFFKNAEVVDHRVGAASKDTIARKLNALINEKGEK